MLKYHTCYPDGEQQADLVLPREHIDENSAEDIRYEIDGANPCTGILIARSQVYASSNGNDLDRTINTCKQCSLQVSEPKRRDDDLPLVRQAIRDVVQSGEEGEEPGLRVSKSLNHPGSMSTVSHGRTLR
jgi:hypothetical protein